MKKLIALTVAVAMAVVAFIALLNYVFYYLRKNIKSNLKTDTIYKSSFGKISYTKAGTGAPIIVIHDLKLGASKKDHDKLIAKLSNTNTVYALDLLGFGGSEKPEIEYSPYLYSNLIKNFINQVVEEKNDITIIAHGTSCGFAVKAYELDKTGIVKIVLNNPYMEYKSPTKYHQYKKLLIDSVIGTCFYNIISLAKYFSDPKEKRDANFYYSNLQGSSKRALTAKYYRFLNVDVQESIAKIEIPVYINYEEEEQMINSCNITGFFNAGKQQLQEGKTTILNYIN